MAALQKRNASIKKLDKNAQNEFTETHQNNVRKRKAELYKNA